MTIRVARHYILSAFRHFVLPKRGGSAEENGPQPRFHFSLYAADGVLDLILTQINDKKSILMTKRSKLRRPLPVSKGPVLREGSIGQGRSGAFRDP